MTSIEGITSSGERRRLDIEVRDAEVYLSIHTPDDTSGLDILVPVDKLRDVIRPRSEWLDGVTPERRNPRRCRVETNTVAISIHAPGGEWWIAVSRAELEQALA